MNSEVPQSLVSGDSVLLEIQSVNTTKSPDLLIAVPESVTVCVSETSKVSGGEWFLLRSGRGLPGRAPSSLESEEDTDIPPFAKTPPPEGAEDLLFADRTVPHDSGH